MQVKLFWLLTMICTFSALIFVVPALWLGNMRSSSWTRKFNLSLVLSMFVVLFSYCLYFYLGAGLQLTEYYSRAASEQRVLNNRLRPLYASLQGDLLKNQLNISGLNNLDLILNFAQMHSKITSGLLQAEIKLLLENIVAANPQQITALNLLAVHAYKTANYPQAIAYWQHILQQVTVNMHGGAAERAIKEKIAQAQLFESNQTNLKK